MVLGGGAQAALYNGVSLVGYASAPAYSQPRPFGDAWEALFEQSAFGGATRAEVTIYAVCATVEEAP